MTAVFMTTPLAYEILKWLGAAYLLWLKLQLDPILDDLFQRLMDVFSGFNTNQRGAA